MKTEIGSKAHEGKVRACGGLGVGVGVGAGVGVGVQWFCGWST